MFWSTKNSGEVFSKLKSREFRAISLCTYDFSTLCTTLPHILFKGKLLDSIEQTFKREETPYLACNDKKAFSLLHSYHKRYKLWSFQNCM